MNIARQIMRFGRAQTALKILEHISLSVDQRAIAAIMPLQFKSIYFIVAS